MTLSAKFGSMAVVAKRFPALRPEVLAIIDRNIRASNADVCAACLNGLSVLAGSCNVGSILRLVRFAIFKPIPNWYHAGYILKLIKCLPVDVIGLEQVLGLMIDFCLLPRDQLWMQAKDAILHVCSRSNFGRVTTIIAGRIDFMSEVELAKLLTVLTNLIRKWKDLSTVHLRFLVFGVLEALRLNLGKLDFLIGVFRFLAAF
jgi:hypothetical protein